MSNHQQQGAGLPSKQPFKQSGKGRDNLPPKKR